MLSIMDCPGKNTRRKRKLRNRNFGSNNIFTKLMSYSFSGGEGIGGLSKMMQSLRKSSAVTNTLNEYEEDDNEGGEDREEEVGYKWGEGMVMESIGRMRCAWQQLEENRTFSFNDEDVNRNKLNSGWNLKVSVHSSPLSSLASPSFNNDDHCYDSSDGVRQWERRALRHLKRNEYKQASNLFLSILSTYESHIERSKEINTNEVQVYKCHVGTTLHNIGICCLFDLEWADAVLYLRRATEVRACCLGRHHLDYISSLTRTGIAYYAQDLFLQARHIWQDALALLYQSKSKTNTSDLLEVLNNLACTEFEIGQVRKAGQGFQKALKTLRKGNDGYSGSKTRQREYGRLSNNSNWKVAVIKSNLGYVALKKKQGKLAIDAFQAALENQNTNGNQDEDLTTAMRENLALAYLSTGQNQNALKVYNTLLERQIQQKGPNHSECKVTLTKIHLLKGGRKCMGSRNKLMTSVAKVKGCCFMEEDEEEENNNDEKEEEVVDVKWQQCHRVEEEKQLERFEKLFKSSIRLKRNSLL